MLDVLLIREFSVEEINAQGVAKAFIDGARMVGILNEHNIVADIDQLAAQQPPRRELASPPLAGNVFRQAPLPVVPVSDDDDAEDNTAEDTDATDEPEATDSFSKPAAAAQEQLGKPATSTRMPLPASRPAPAATTDAIAHLFGFNTDAEAATIASVMPITRPSSTTSGITQSVPIPEIPGVQVSESASATPPSQPSAETSLLFRIQLAGPGLNTQLDVVDADDLALVRALLDKIERRLRR
ncbi:MAG: hypothetical protein EOO60_13460 [Hymenobacter sp.]|nr:MAG: hypothetical protein EOO60_13460 [Hymenobacter sp.]